MREHLLDHLDSAGDPENRRSELGRFSLEITKKAPPIFLFGAELGETLLKSFFRNQFIDGCSAIPAAQGIDGAQVNHDLGSLKPCAYRSHRACPT